MRFSPARPLAARLPRLTVTLPVDGALVESHDVLGERAGLVREDVLDLAQLLVQRGGPGLGRGVAAGMVHLPVPVYVEAVAQADELHAGGAMDDKTEVDPGSDTCDVCIV